MSLSQRALPDSEEIRLPRYARPRISPRFPFWLPASGSKDTSSRQLLILRSAGFFLEPSFGSAKRQLSPAGRIQNREILSFQRIPQTPRRPSPPGRLISLHPPPPSTPSAPARRRSFLPSPRRAAWSDGSRPTAASNTGRA